MAEPTLYFNRCGWCGAYEGTVDPKEPCAKDATGYIGPHQFGVYERAPQRTEDRPQRIERECVVAIDPDAYIAAVTFPEWGASAMPTPESFAARYPRCTGATGKLIVDPEPPESKRP